MKKTVYFVVIGLMASAKMSFANVSDWAEAQYNAMGSVEIQLQFSTGDRPIVGMSVDQKDTDDGFCRKYAQVVPNPVSTFACFRATSVGAEAQQTYQSLNAVAENVRFFSNGGAMLGVSYTEKEVQQINGQLICAVSYPIVPNPVMSYVCYQEIIPLGGGISVGN